MLQAQSLKDFKSKDFISLSVPANFQGQMKYLDATDKVTQLWVSDVKHDASLLHSFPNVVSSVTLFEVDKGGSLSLLGNNFSARNTTYVVIYDFTQTQTLQLSDDKVVYFALIGVSVRMVARIKTKTAGINLTNLFGLGIAANSKKVTGTLEVRTNGICSQKINGIIPVTSDLSPASIENALQAVATIKSHIYDPDTKITPQFLAFSLAGQDGTFDYKQICDNLYSYKFKN